MITLRPATAADQKRIVEVIREAEINPMDLKWQNFLLAVDDATGQVVGTAQIKRHGDGSRELASIATIAAYQKRGIATRLIEALLAQNPDRLYLTCLRYMVPFYEKFGFALIPPADYTPYFKRLNRLAQVFQFFSKEDWKMQVMRRG